MEKEIIPICPLTSGLKEKGIIDTCEEIANKMERARKRIREKAREVRIGILEELPEFKIGDKIIGYFDIGFDVGYEEYDYMSRPVSGIITEINSISSIPGDVEYYVVNEEDEHYSGWTERGDTIEYDEETWNKIKEKYKSRI